MGRKIIRKQITSKLHSLIAFGQSRHEAKNDLQNNENYSFGNNVDTIHSVVTFDVYLKSCQAFGDWLIEEKTLSPYTNIEKCKHLASEYIQNKIDRYNEDSNKGNSIWSIKKDRAALGKLYGERIPVIDMPKRDRKHITRSRFERVRDKHFSLERNQDLITIACATGGRRSDIEKLTTKDFNFKEGHLWVTFHQSKGGRDRITPVLRSEQHNVLLIVKSRELEGKEKIFDQIHRHADIHAYRREYCSKLLEDVQKDRVYRDALLKQYPPRCEPNIKGKTLTTRSREINVTYDRNDLYICSSALGHNRLEVVTSHYLC